MLNRKVFSALGGLLAAVPALAYESSYNMPMGVTAIAREVHGLHMQIFWVCVAIAVAVFGVMIYSIVAFRKSNGAVPDRTLLHSTKVEVIWTIIPVAILIFMAVPAAKTLVKMEDTRNAELSVKVTGYQWKWQYEYLGKGVSFYSSLATESNYARQLNSGVDVTKVKDYLLDVDNAMVVPVDTKVRVLLTGNDVIHSWWVPDFAVKKDAIPGFINEAWFKVDTIGRYTGQCAELCGRDHGFMPIVVNVVSKEDFAKWLAAQQQATKAATTTAPAAPAAAAL
ncbi:MAG: cytochrome c oxidase subunit II [Proteobacteria bacterium]|nr:cytochrome c oxidase subunit II [Pseudomonadota bacterium]